MSRQIAHVYSAASAASLVTLLVGYFAFRRLLIFYQTLSHGHPNPFVIGPEINAAMLAVVTAAIVFWLAVRRGKRNRSQT
jgi:membrane-anchored protein YejM (alkaline phosphatase superfamily)